MKEVSKVDTVSRRDFLGGALAVGAGVAIAPAILSGNADAAEESSSGSGKGQLAFWVDTKECIHCGMCVAACRTANKTEKDKDRRKLTPYENASGETVYVSTSCMHCSQPSCATVCPATAITKREADGIVVVDEDRCIGCKYCYLACPFSVPQYDSVAMDKCDFCLSIGVEPGSAPSCVSECPTGALNSGWLMDILHGDKEVTAVQASTGPSILLS